MIIDAEFHLFLEEKTQGKLDSGKYCERYWDEGGEIKIRISQDAANVDKFLKFMDDAGIDMAMLSTNVVKSLEEMKRWNDLCARTVKAHPKRFLGMASIPPAGGKPALDELDRAINELGLKGVHIWARNDGHFMDSKKMWPFYEQVSKLNIPVDVHIRSVEPGFEALHAPYALYYILMREFDMAATTMRVCLGGVLEDFPDLILIMNHFGGGVSSVLERFDVYSSYADRPGWPDFYYGQRLISKPWREYFNKLYFNMAGRELGMETVRCALTNISPQKLLFATDWPFNYDYEPELVKKYMADIRKLDLPQEDIDAMLGGNAARLFGVNA